MRFFARTAEDTLLKGLVSRTKQGSAVNTFQTGLDFVKHATLARAITLQKKITGLEIFPVTGSDVGPHRFPSALEDCGHRNSGYALNNRLRKPAE